MVSKYRKALACTGGDIAVTLKPGKREAGHFKAWSRIHTMEVMLTFISVLTLHSLLIAIVAQFKAIRRVLREIWFPDSHSSQFGRALFFMLARSVMYREACRKYIEIKRIVRRLTYKARLYPTKARWISFQRAELVVYITQLFKERRDAYKDFSRVINSYYNQAAQLKEIRVDNLGLSFSAVGIYFVALIKRLQAFFSRIRY